MSQETSKERINQKARTRTALLEAAGAFIREGKRPTVEEAANAAGISKRTAYRYFVSQEHMLADAALEGLRPRMDDILSSVSASDDVHSRVASLAGALRRLAEEHDLELREMIRASLDNGSKLNGSGAPMTRGRRRLDWVKASLQPVQEQIPPANFEMLVNCISVCVGVDALFVLRDICGLEGEEAENLMIWMSNALLDKALEESRPETK